MEQPDIAKILEEVAAKLFRVSDQIPNESPAEKPAPEPRGTAEMAERLQEYADSHKARKAAAAKFNRPSDLFFPDDEPGGLPEPHRAFTVARLRVKRRLHEIAWYLEDHADFFAGPGQVSQPAGVQDVQEDGPIPPNRFCWKGQVDDLPPRQWMLVNLLWDGGHQTFRRMTLSFDELKNTVWDEQDVNDTTIRAAVSRLGNWFLRMNIPFQARTKQLQLVVEPT